MIYELLLFVAESSGDHGFTATRIFSTEEMCLEEGQKQKRALKKKMGEGFTVDFKCDSRPDSFKREDEIGEPEQLISSGQSYSPQSKQGAIDLSITPSMAELSKLQRSSDAVKYFVYTKVYPESGLKEARFRNMPEREKNNLAESAFYLACLRLAGEMEWTKSEVAILNSLVDKMQDNKSYKSVILDFEREFYKNHLNWPNIVAVDVSAIEQRFIEKRIIR